MVEKLMFGLIVFVILASTKQWIYPLVFPQPSDPNYPIYAAGEAFTNPATGNIEAELYIVNLQDRALDTDVIVRWRRADSPLP